MENYAQALRETEEPMLQLLDLRHLVITLFNNGALTEDNLERIQSKEHPRDRNRELIRLLCRNAEEAFHLLQDYLISINPTAQHRELRRLLLATHLKIMIASNTSINGADDPNKNDSQTETPLPGNSARNFNLPEDIENLMQATDVFLQTNISQFINNLNRHELQQRLDNGDNLMQFIVNTFRELQSDINDFLFDDPIRSGPIMQESHPDNMN